MIRQELRLDFDTLRSCLPLRELDVVVVQQVLRIH